MHEGFSQGRDVRARGTNATRCGLRPKQYCEGKGRYSLKELVQFLYHARGSLLELQTQITVAERLGYLSEPDAINLAGRPAMVGRLLNGLVHRFKPSLPSDERSAS